MTDQNYRWSEEEMLTIKLVLDDVVEDLQEKEDQVVVGGTGVEEPRSAESLQRANSIKGLIPWMQKRA